MALAVPSAAAAQPATLETGADQARASRSDPVLRLGARVHTDYRFVDNETDNDPNNLFVLRRARLSIDLTPAPWLTGQLDIDVATPTLKDGFVTITAPAWLSVTAGQLKKPFSRLELTGPGKLPLWRRGIVNERMIDQLGFGGRDIGAAAKIRVADLRFSLGVFNGNGTLPEADSGKDAAARITYRLLRALRLGASVAMKYRSRPAPDPTVPNSDPRKDIWAAGIDGRLRIGPVDFLLDGTWAMDGTTQDGRNHLGAASYLLLRLRSERWLQVRPVVKAEVLDDDSSNKDDAAVSFGGGVNLHLGDFLRLMVQAEQVLPQDESSVPREFVFVLRLAFDGKLDLALARPPEPQGD